jgi:hypothetical protein
LMQAACAFVYHGKQTSSRSTPMFKVLMPCAARMSYARWESFVPSGGGTTYCRVWAQVPRIASHGGGLGPWPQHAVSCARAQGLWASCRCLCSSSRGYALPDGCAQWRYLGFERRVDCPGELGGAHALKREHLRLGSTVGATASHSVPGKW